MNLFDRLVDEALKSRPELLSLQSVVEKELLHHDILREMGAAGLLQRLTFMGGTCLRACYGSERLSEDLDFAGGSDFRRETLRNLGEVLEHTLEAKYGLKVTVSPPVKESSGVDTWKLKIITRPERKNLPAQRINIDICAVPSRDRRPMMLRNIYAVDMGTSGLILQARSREEILSDKIVALAFRPNRVKNRDLWDIAWLKRQGVELRPEMIPLKLADHRRKPADFKARLQARTALMQSRPRMRKEFSDEMRRFLPARLAAETVEQDVFWEYLSEIVQTECRLAVKAAIP